MSASDTGIREKKRKAGRQVIVYTCTALFCGLFSAVYEHFSHGVRSNFMIWLFAFPVLLGALPCAVIGLSRRLPFPSRQAAGAWDCGVTTLALGSCVRGVLDIYGTGSAYTAFYLPAGLALLGTGFLFYLRGVRQTKKRAGDAV